MILIIKLVGVQLVLQLILSHLGGKLPSNEEIARELATPTCILEVAWEHKHAQHFSFSTDPRYDDPKQQEDKAIVFQAPHQRIIRAFNVMERCRRLEILREMIRNGLVLGRHWDQPDPPPLDPSCHLEKYTMRVWDVRNYAFIRVNDIPFLHVMAGQFGDAKVNHVAEVWMYDPNAQPGDSGWVDLTPMLKPGENWVHGYLSNVGIPSGFLNLGRTPSRMTLKTRITYPEYQDKYQDELTWHVDYQPDMVGPGRLKTSKVYVSVICDKGGTK